MAVLLGLPELVSVRCLLHTLPSTIAVSLDGNGPGLVLPLLPLSPDRLMQLVEFALAHRLDRLSLLCLRQLGYLSGHFLHGRCQAHRPLHFLIVACEFLLPQGLGSAALRELAYRPHFLSVDLAILLLLEAGVSSEESLFAQGRVAEAVGNGVLRLVDPRSDADFDIAQVLNSGLLEVACFVLYISGQRYVPEE